MDSNLIKFKKTSIAFGLICSLTLFCACQKDENMVSGDTTQDDSCQATDETYSCHLNLSIPNAATNETWATTPNKPTNEKYLSAAQAAPTKKPQGSESGKGAAQDSTADFESGAGAALGIDSIPSQAPSSDDVVSIVAKSPNLSFYAEIFEAFTLKNPEYFAGIDTFLLDINSLEGLTANQITTLAAYCKQYHAINIRDTSSISSVNDVLASSKSSLLIKLSNFSVSGNTYSATLTAKKGSANEISATYNAQVNQVQDIFKVDIK